MVFLLYFVGSFIAMDDFKSFLPSLITMKRDYCFTLALKLPKIAYYSGLVSSEKLPGNH
jgi:hypothetical protein